MNFLVDTDTVSAHLKGSRAVTNRFLQYGGGICVSVVTLGELYTWALRAAAPSQRLTDLGQLIRDMHVLDVTPDVAHRFGQVRAALLDQGLPPPDMDLLIAATALVHNLTLVTHNVQDFANVPGLRVVDWLA